jgi:uncharacterized membrane protein YGL010W
MRKIDALLADYASYHATKGNVACHFVGIPLIVFGILSMLLAVPIATLAIGFTVTAAEVLILLAGIYYLTLDARLGVAMVLATVLLDVLARAAGNAWIGVAAFVIGWIFQGIGHARYEHKAPAFLKNFVHLLVGPVFLVNEVLRVRAVHAPAEART